MADFSPLQVAIMRAGTATTPWDNNPGLGGYLAEAQQQAAQQRAYDAQTRMQQYELGREEQLAKLFEGVDTSDPAVMERLALQLLKIKPELGLKMMQQQRLLREQQMMESLVSGGGIGQMGDAGAYIMAGSENPILRGVGEKQLADIKTQQEIDKEERKPATEAQANAANFATRMAEAEQLLTPLEQSGVSTADITQRAKSNVPFVGNYLTSDEFKQYNQAAQDWVRAKLRKESGAVIGEEEMNKEIETYFPRPGDTPAVIEQKRKARSTALSGVASAAKAGFKLPAADTVEQPAPSAGQYKVGDIITANGKKYRVIGGDPNDPDVEPVE